ncbi:MAG: ATP synthase F0 subunit B [Bdellovibrionales bacterium]|nr:ATP synthase F0 subunit B [Bdellovibrionales bacterium]
MSQVLEILTSLGIDSTFFYQFVIFFIAFLSMNFIVFRPYLNAHDERIRRTVGGQKEAEDLMQSAAKEEEIYKAEARKLNSEIREIFATSNAKAKKETEEILNQAKTEADQEVEKGRKSLEATIQEVRKEMEAHIPEISKKIETKFTGPLQ